MPAGDLGWWDDAYSAAQQFLRNNNNQGITAIPVYGAQRAGCQSSLDCASGWSCRSGLCQPPSSTGIDTSGCGDPSDPLNPSCPASNIDGDCTQTGAGEDDDCFGGGYEACCSQVRCCRYSTNGVRCGCGPCVDLDLCDGFCSDYGDANGEEADNCDSKGCDECTDCKFWGFSGTTNIYKCVPKDKAAAPCHCERPEEEGEDAKGCPDCEVCEEDGTCSPNDPECDICAERSGPCECAPETTISKQVCQNYEQQLQGRGNLQAIADREWEEACEELCEEECVEQEGRCSTKTYCSDTGTGSSECPAGMKRTGILEAGGEKCSFCEDCSEKVGGVDCCTIECSCHTDCGPCKECVNGECKDKAKCPGKIVYVGTFNQAGNPIDGDKVYFYWDIEEGEADVYGFQVFSATRLDHEDSPNSDDTPGPGVRGTTATATPVPGFCENSPPGTISGRFYMMLRKWSGVQGGVVEFVGGAPIILQGCEKATMTGTFTMYPPGAENFPTPSNPNP